MKAKPLPSQERLRELFDYDQETGVLTWKVSSHKCASNIRVGGSAGCLNNTGYYHTRIGTDRFLNHRLIWMWMTGEDPGDLDIDHINRVRSDNSWENLRVVSRGVNISNSIKVNNTSGVPGITWEKAARKWSVRAYVDGARKFFGRFQTKEEAITRLKQVAPAHHIIHTMELTNA